MLVFPSFEGSRKTSQVHLFWSINLKPSVHLNNFAKCLIENVLPQNLTSGLDSLGLTDKITILSFPNTKLALAIF